MASKPKVIVKVGRESNIRFRNAEAFRAITIRELERLCEIHQDANIVVIEKIKPEDGERIKRFISKYESSGINKVYFYVADNDDDTCGIADELAYDIYLNDVDLYRAIRNNSGIDISCRIENVANIDKGMEEFDTEFTEYIGIGESNKAEGIVKEINSLSDLGEIIPIYHRDSEYKVLNKPVGEGIESRELQETISKLKKAEGEIDKLRVQIRHSFDRNRILQDLVAAVEKERDALQDRAKLIETSEVMENPIPMSEYVDIKIKLEEALDTKGENSEELEGEIIALRSQINELETTLESYKNRLRESGTNLSNAKVEISKHLAVITQLKDKIEELSKGSKDLDKLRDDINSQKEKIAELTLDVNRHKDRAGKLSKEIEGYEIRERELNRGLVEEQSARVMVVGLLSKAAIKCTELSKKVDELEEEVEYLKTNESMEVETKVSTLNSERELLKSKVEVYEAELRKCKNGIRQRDEQISKLKAEKHSQEQLQEIQEEFNRQEIEDWKERYHKAVEDSKNLVSEQVKSLQAKNIELERKLRDAREQLKNNSKPMDIQDNTDAYSNVEESHSTRPGRRTSRGNFTVRENKGSNGNEFEYRGKAKIISIFGCGSYGVTTTAMSITNILGNQNNVIYIDMDFGYAKSDAWFKRSPMLMDVPNDIRNTNKATALGVIIEKGADYFISNSANLILNISHTRHSCIDYIGGLYETADKMKLENCDFSKVFNYLGSKYDYIIIDFGKFGTHEYADQLIRSLSRVAFRNIAVSTGDRFDVKTFKMRLAENRINSDNVSWILNMCERTSLDENTRRTIHPSKYFLIPFSMDIYGKRLDFTRNKITKDKFEMYLSEMGIGG